MFSISVGVFFGVFFSATTTPPPPAPPPTQKNDKKFTIPDASKLISAPLPELKSALREAKGGGLERALLEVVVSKTVKTRGDAAE